MHPRAARPRPVVCSTRELGAVGGAIYKGNDNLAQDLIDLTGENKGFNVALDCVARTQNEAIAEILKIDSRWILYSLLSGFVLKETSLLRTILKKRIHLKGTTLRTRSNSFKADLIAKFNSKVVPLFEQGKLRNVVDTSYQVKFGDAEAGAKKVEEAHALMKQNKNMGKIILNFE